MNKQAFLDGYMEKNAGGFKERIVPYAASMLPFGSTIYGASNANKNESSIAKGLKTGIGTGMTQLPLAAAGAVGRLSILNIARKNPQMIPAIVALSLAGGLGALVAGGEATYRLGKRNEVK